MRDDGEEEQAMHMHEFQAKELLASHDIAIPRGRVADNGADAERIARRFTSDRYVVKAQVLSGDREGAGGVCFADTPQSVRQTADGMIGRVLVTPQTGPRGEKVRWVYIEEAVHCKRQLYAAVSLDRASGMLILLSSGSGGSDLEARSKTDHNLIKRRPLRLDKSGAVGDFEGLAKDIGLSGSAAAEAAQLFARLGRIAATLDATLVEINPLALTDDDRLVALDAKVTIDDNAMLRHPAFATMRAAFQMESGDPEELGADEHQLNYQRLDGDIGLVANGAGLALATLDMITDAGGRAANFMDIRTTASSLDVAYGLELLLASQRVKAILVNVHGGGMQRCDTIAEAIGVAMRRAKITKPLVVRMAGNNAEFARMRLQSYGIRFEEGADMSDAVKRAVALARREAA
ncbi:MAG: succinyl-CoA synthetase subunit beta [Hyphomicrobium sp.]|nr:MAG: succinyl-CoA synthetase subunit beta [Hyphomicrobium sp.]